MSSNILYYKLLALGACLESTIRYKGMSYDQALEFITNEHDLEFLITALATKGHLKHPDIVDRHLSGSLLSAFCYADKNTPYDKSGHTSIVQGRPVIDEMLTIITPNMLKRAMAKVKI